MTDSTEKQRAWFRARHRLSRDRDYAAVLASRVRKSHGPITLWSRPNKLEHARLGLSIGRRTGPAVRRNAIKRRLREAFRMLQREIPSGFDYIATVRAHEPGKTQDYMTHLRACADSLEREWRRRKSRADGGRDGS